MRNTSESPKNKRESTFNKPTLIVTDDDAVRDTPEQKSYQRICKGGSLNLL